MRAIDPQTHACLASAICSEHCSAAACCCAAAPVFTLSCLHLLAAMPGAYAAVWPHLAGLYLRTISKDYIYIHVPKP